MTHIFTRTLTPRDLDILRTLSLRARLASLQQINQTWWNDGEKVSDACRQRLCRLIASGLLSQQRVSAIALFALHAPLATWSPGRSTPNLGALAWTLHRRWRVAPRPTTIYLATPRCARYFGGRRRGRVPRAFQVSHDLGVTEMFLAIRRTAPEIAAHWLDEDRLAPTRRGQKLPDAVVTLDQTPLPALVLEFGGDYPKSRLQAFHEDCEARGLPYQIW